MLNSLILTSYIIITIGYHINFRMCCQRAHISWLIILMVQFTTVCWQWLSRCDFSKCRITFIYLVKFALNTSVYTIYWCAGSASARVQQNGLLEILNMISRGPNNSESFIIARDSINWPPYSAYSGQKLDLPPAMHCHNVFHTRLLKQHVSSTLNFLHRASDPPTPPIVTDASEEFEVDSMLDHKFLSSGYLVQWESFNTAYDTWEPPSHLWNSPGLLDQYKAMNCLSSIAVQGLRNPFVRYRHWILFSS